MKNRVFSILLVLVLIVGLMPTTVFAATDVTSVCGQALKQ